MVRQQELNGYQDLSAGAAWPHVCITGGLGMSGGKSGVGPGGAGNGGGTGPGGTGCGGSGNGFGEPGSGIPGTTDFG
ncbi:MAG: hypothetical protein JO076_15200 [Verrucomicrobia bacterium]|nr:hypothetical protein [Verrucomicrobiota bacterium]